MERITDAWDGLGKREQVLAVIAVVVLVLVLAAFLLFGGGDPVAPVDASTSTSEAVPAKPEPEPQGLVIDDQSTVVARPGVPAAPVEAPQGVAGLTVSGGAGGDATGGAETTPYNEGVPPVPEVVDPRRYEPPVVSDAIKAAGRDLERVGAAYRACMERAAAANADSRHCVNDALKYGVEISKGGLHRDGGLTLAKRSSDGHTVYLTFINGGECRALDDGDSCDAWTT